MSKRLHILYGYIPADEGEEKKMYYIAVKYIYIVKLDGLQETAAVT